MRSILRIRSARAPRAPDGLLDIFHVAAQGVIAGANLVLIDFHPDPAKALVDGPQALLLSELDHFLADVATRPRDLRQARGARAASRRALTPIPMPAHIELEIKLRLAPENRHRVLGHPRVAALRHAPATSHRLLATYFDTSQQQLARAGFALRVRKERGKWMQTLKGPQEMQAGGGLSARCEHEWPLPAQRTTPAPDLDLMQSTRRWPLLRAARKDLRARFTTAFERDLVPLAFEDGTTATLCVDSGTIAGDGRAQPVCEIEIELEQGRLVPLFDLALELASAIPLAVEVKSKAQRGYALLRPAAEQAVHAHPVDVSPQRLAAQALAVTLRNCLEQIESNADGLRDDDAPEWVHQMRVGVRRLRACLGLMRPTAMRDEAQALDVEARWLARSLGPARDLDVLCTQTLATIGGDCEPRPPDAASIATLATRLRAARERARRAARNAVASARFTLLVLRTARLAALLDDRAASEAGEGLSSDVRQFAAQLLEHRHRRLVKRGGRMHRGSVKRLHETRIAAKKMRYATEFFAALSATGPLRAYRRTLTRLQEVLGAINDAQAAARMASEVAGAESAAARVVKDWAACKTKAMQPKLRRAWKRFANADVFWVSP